MAEPLKAAPFKRSLKGRRILVLRNDRIGDLVLALPLVQALKDAGSFVGVLVAPFTEALLKSDRRVDLVLVDQAGVMEKIKAGAFDTVFCVWGNWRNAWLAWRSGIPTRIGPGMRPFSWLFTRRLDLRRSQGWSHESDLNLDYARALGLNPSTDPPSLRLPPDCRRQARAWLKRKGPKGEGPLVLLHPGSGGSAQPWPAERFADLGRILARRHQARLLLTGGPGDESVVQTCASVLGDSAKLCVDLDLPTFAALLGEADLFVAGSTGPLHLAAAQGTPVLGLYPPLRAMSPLRWGPRGSRRAVLSPAGLGFRIPPTPGLNFLERISVDEAAAACGFLLEPPAAV